MSLCFLDAVHVKILPQVTPRVSEDEARRGAGRLWEGRRVAPQPGLPEFRPPAVPRGWVPLPGAAGCGAASYDDCVAEQKIPASPGLHSSPERLRAGLGRRRRSLGGSTGSPRGDFSRGFSTAPPVPPHPPPPRSGPGSRYGCAPEAPVAAASAVADSRPSAALPVTVGAACRDGSGAVGPALLLPRGRRRGGRGWGGLAAAALGWAEHRGGGGRGAGWPRVLPAVWGPQSRALGVSGPRTRRPAPGQGAAAHPGGCC